MSEDQQQTPEPQERTFRLPDSVMADIKDCSIELLVGVGKSSEENVAELEDRLGIKLPDAGFHPEPPPDMPHPEFPPLQPLQPLPPRLTAEEIARRDFFGQLAVTQQLLSMLMQLRHNQMSSGDSVPEGEEWKSGGSASTEYLPLVDGESKLYEAVLDRLTRYVTDGPPPPPGDPPVL